METVKMSEDCFMEISHWLKQNKVDGIWFDTVDDCYPKDRYLKVTLIKNTDAKTWGITRMIDTMDFCRCYFWDWLEDIAKELNDDAKKTEEDSK